MVADGQRVRAGAHAEAARAWPSATQVQALNRLSRPYGSLVTDELGVKLRVHFIWQGAGPITVAADGKVVFPTLPTEPGLYRMTLVPGGSGRARVYVGETDQLRRRFAHYRNPGPTQHTNIRINAALREHVAGGGGATLEVALSGTIETESGMVPLDLSKSTHRRLAENAAQVWAELTGDVETLNLTRGISRST